MKIFFNNFKNIFLTIIFLILFCNEQSIPKVIKKSFLNSKNLRDGMHMVGC